VRDSEVPVGRVVPLGPGCPARGHELADSLQEWSTTSPHGGTTVSPVNQRRVLVVEDEPTIAQSVAARLRGEGYLVDIAADGPSAVSAAAAYPPDIVVLDVMLPGFDGLEVCRRIQAERPVPVLMVTARGDETDMLIGLGVGADDYLTKPFSMRELAARVAVLLRRVDRAASVVPKQLGPLRINAAERRVFLEESEVHLTPTEFDLLSSLASRPRAVHSREQLLSTVWGWSDAFASRTVDSHIKSLRRKIGAKLIRTVHGVGYALEIPR
jgi:DNA-binding response OmpR family regulator